MIFILLVLLTTYREFVLTADIHKLNILAPQKPEIIQFTYPHFVHFLGMMHFGVRESGYGFLEEYRDNYFAEKLNFKVYNVMVFLSDSVLEKFGKDRFSNITSLMNSSFLDSFYDYDNLLMYLWTKRKIFQAEMQKVIDQRDIMSSWQLFFLWFLTSAYYLPPDNSEMPNKVTVADEVSASYIYLMCSRIRERGLDDPICPDPCKRSPCASTPNVATEICFQDKLGLFENDFRCQCRHGFNWKPSTKTCEPFDICLTENVCYKHGTFRCVYIPDKMESRCECKVSYMGGTCSILRDPCIETSSHTEMSGNMYCNTGQGNQCVGIPGTDQFECVCSKSWTQDYSYSVSNCLSFRDLCSKSVCQSGDCVSSKDGQTTRCVCPPELTGEYCNLKRSIWGRWLPWSTCDPICGPVRRSVRVRFCNGYDCLGERRQVKYCEPNYCGSHPMFEQASAFRWKSNYYQMFAFTFLIIIVNFFVCVLATMMLIIVIFPFIAEKIAVLIPK